MELGLRPLAARVREGQSAVKCGRTRPRKIIHHLGGHTRREETSGLEVTEGCRTRAAASSVSTNAAGVP